MAAFPHAQQVLLWCMLCSGSLMAQPSSSKKGALSTRKIQDRPPIESVSRSLSLDDTLRFATSYEPVVPVESKPTNIAPVTSESSVSPEPQSGITLPQEAATTNLSMPVHKTIYRQENLTAPPKSTVLPAVKRTIPSSSPLVTSDEMSDLERVLNRKKRSN